MNIYIYILWIIVVNVTSFSICKRMIDAAFKKDDRQRVLDEEVAKYNEEKLAEEYSRGIEEGRERQFNQMALDESLARLAKQNLADECSKQEINEGCRCARIMNGCNLRK